MLNILQMENTRFLKSKSTYILLIAALLVFSLSIVLLGTALSTEEESETGNANVSITLEKNEDLLRDLNHAGEDLLVSNFSQVSTIPYLVIFSSLFLTAPFQHGFVKNFIGYKNNRVYLVLADFLVLSLFTLISFILINLFVYFLMRIFLETDTFGISNVKMLFKYLGFQLYYHICFMGVMTLLCTLIRSRALSITIALLYSVVMYPMIRGMVNHLMLNVVKVSDKFDFLDYTIIGSITKGAWGASSSVLTHGAVASTIIALLSLVAAVLVMKQKDIA